jgi:hypothetical protein
MRFTIEVFALAYVLVAALFATPTVVDMYSAKGLGECREVTVKMLTDLLPLRQVERFTPAVYVGMLALGWLSIFAWGLAWPLDVIRLGRRCASRLRARRGGGGAA